MSAWSHGLWMTKNNSQIFTLAKCRKFLCKIIKICKNIFLRRLTFIMWKNSIWDIWKDWKVIQYLTKRFHRTIRWQMRDRGKYEIQSCKKSDICIYWWSINNHLLVRGFESVSQQRGLRDDFILLGVLNIIFELNGKSSTLLILGNIVNSRNRQQHL